MYTATLLLAVLGASNALAFPLDLQTEAAEVDVRTVGRRTVSAQESNPDWAHGGDCASSNLPGCVGGHGEEDDQNASRSVGAGQKKRWINPPSTISVGFGTACSLETCDMCPTFPGCESASADNGDNGDNSDDSDGDDDETTGDNNPKKRWISPITTLPTEFGTACSLETCDMCPTFPGCGSGEMKAGHKSALSTTEHEEEPPVVEEKRSIMATGPAPKPGSSRRGDWEQPPRREKRVANISPIVVSGGVEIGAGPECSVLTCDLCPDHPGCEDGGQTWDDGEPPK